MAYEPASSITKIDLIEWHVILLGTISTVAGQGVKGAYFHIMVKLHGGCLGLRFVDSSPHLDLVVKMPDHRFRGRYLQILTKSGLEWLMVLQVSNIRPETPG